MNEQTSLPPDVEEDEEEYASPQSLEFRKMWLLLGLGWVSTNVGYSVVGLPLKFMLKDQMHISAAMMSQFMFIGHSTNYIKPVAGILIDYIPLFGYRRRGYLLLNLCLCAFGYLLFSFLPHEYTLLLVTYTIMYMTVVFISATLGGVMVETGAKFRTAGRLTAQRIGSFRVAAVVGELSGGFLAKLPLYFATSITATCHLILLPLYFYNFKEPRNAKLNREGIQHAKRQFVALFHNRSLMSAAVMIFLIAIAPGFGTPLFYYQTNTLHIPAPYLGVLGVIGGTVGIAGAWFYTRFCRRFSIRAILFWSIIQHSIGTLLYLFYHDQASATWISAIEALTGILATLPVYDLGARATPKGSEALGYSIMMSVWNLSSGLSDWVGSKLFDLLHQSFTPLIYINSATTLIALVAIPFLPKALLTQKDAN